MLVNSSIQSPIYSINVIFEEKKLRSTIQILKLNCVTKT